MAITWPAKNNYATGDVLTATNMNGIGDDLNDLYAQTISGGSGYAAGKNKCINGGFDIWQRSTSNATTGYQTADRWYQICAGTTTVSQDTDVPSAGLARYSMKQLTSAGSSYAQYQYSLEQAEVIPLRGKTITVSWYMKVNATWTGTFAQGNYFYSTSTDARSNLNVAVTAGYTNPTGCTPTTSWARYYETITIPADAVGFQKQFNPSLAQASGAALWIANVQFEVGSVPSTFQRAGGSIQGELAACQRYYEKSYDLTTNPASVTGSGATGVVCGTNAANAYFTCFYPFKVSKRSAPTITLYDTAGASGKITKVSAVDLSSTDGQTGTADRISVNSFRIYANLTSCGGFYAHYVAEAEL